MFGGGGIFNDGFALGKYSANFSKNAPKHSKYRKKTRKKQNPISGIDEIKRNDWKKLKKKHSKDKSNWFWHCINVIVFFSVYKRWKSKQENENEKQTNKNENKNKTKKNL